MLNKTYLCKKASGSTSNIQPFTFTGAIIKRYSATTIWENVFKMVELDTKQERITMELRMRRKIALCGEVILADMEEVRRIMVLH
jgi:hypothetical protein